jgi:hypothetical protein
MSRGATARRPCQGEERGSGAGKQSDALPPGETGAQLPGQAIESLIIHTTPPLPVFANAGE